MTEAPSYDYNSILTTVAVGSFFLSLLTFAGSIIFFRHSYNQNASFKAVDIERDEILEIRECVSQFLQATTERIGAEQDALSLTKSKGPNKANPDKTFQAGAYKGDNPERLFAYHDLRRGAYSRQGVYFEKLRLLLDDRDAKREVLLDCMLGLMGVKKLETLANTDFISLVVETIAARQRSIGKRIGLKNA